MKKGCAFILLLLICFSSKAAIKDSTINYSLPDSVKVVQFMAEIKVGDFGKTKIFRTGIRTDVVSLYIDNYYRSPAIRFQANDNERWQNVVYGLQASYDLKYGHIQFHYDWKVNETYKLMIAQTGDSAGNFSLYSGYIFLPAENKWKLVGTINIKNKWHTIQQPSFFCVTGKRFNTSITTGQVWCQRSNGSWKNMKNETLPNPVINLFGHVDSVRQREIEIKAMVDKSVDRDPDIKALNTGIFYKMLKEGTGRQVSINDTVTVFYKGYLFANDSVFDKTNDTPATFPLKRLIKGWQIGLTLCKIGGKIKLIIPSDMAYSIRTRAAKIPPNSILVFEIEVVDAKSPL